MESKVAYITVDEKTYRMSLKIFEKLFVKICFENSFISGTHINSKLVDFNGKLYYVFKKYIPELEKIASCQMKMVNEKDPVDTDTSLNVVTALNALTINEGSTVVVVSLPIIDDHDDYTPKGEEGDLVQEKTKLEKKLSSKDICMDSEVTNLCCPVGRTRCSGCSIVW